MYNMAAAVASQRLPWEPNSLMREELSTVLSNRSAAYAAAGDHVGSLVDADVVIQLKRQWSKGHFRKAKALMELGYLEEAKEAIQLGLSFEPTNTVSQSTCTKAAANCFETDIIDISTGNDDFLGRC
jgi:translocation protein SEC72